MSLITEYLNVKALFLDLKSPFLINAMPVSHLNLYQVT